MQGTQRLTKTNLILRVPLRCLLATPSTENCRIGERGIYNPAFRLLCTTKAISSAAQSVPSYKEKIRRCGNGKPRKQESGENYFTWLSVVEYPMFKCLVCVALWGDVRDVAVGSGEGKY